MGDKGLIDLDQDGDTLWALVNAVRYGEFLDKLRNKLAARQGLCSRELIGN